MKFNFFRKNEKPNIDTVSSDENKDILYENGQSDKDNTSTSARIIKLVQIIDDNSEDGKLFNNYQIRTYNVFKIVKYISRETFKLIYKSEAYAITRLNMDMSQGKIDVVIAPILTIDCEYLEISVRMQILNTRRIIVTIDGAEYKREYEAQNLTSDLSLVSESDITEQDTHFFEQLYHQYKNLCL